MKLIRISSVLAATSLLAVSLVGCSASSSPEEKVQAQVEKMLENMQSGKVQEALDMFDSKNLFDIFDGKLENAPEMKTSYTNIKFSNVKPYGSGENPEYLAEFSFNIGDEKVDQEIQAKVEGSKVKFTSGADDLFGDLSVSTKRLKGSAGQAPYSQMKDVIVEVGGIPIRPSDGDKVLKSVPIGDYSVKVRESEYITVSEDVGSMVKVRPEDEADTVIEMAVKPEAADKLAQDNWEDLSAYIVKCAQVDMTVCDTSKSNIEDASNFWNVTPQGVYLKQVDWENAYGYNTSFMSRDDSIIVVPVIVGGTLLRERDSSSMGNMVDKELAIKASVTISNKDVVGFIVELERQ